jgi:hypothetical protein
MTGFEGFLAMTERLGASSGPDGRSWSRADLHDRDDLHERDERDDR